ncbi:hypothetical protein DSCOOX_04900 [Desulfosarcina ovata subsp. ovata]|uniref:Uncharacterized protein n=2 Tax=Desulfosarcina ovata TaxID=83564 RepID=A0A5K8A4U5_9BACT|nr:hypothetical protein DSCOOX_04900 [Desulfosarcina ovata subsp. ovata]
MLSWWTNFESIVALQGFMLMATVFFSTLTGTLIFLNAKKSSQSTTQLSKKLSDAQKQIKSLEKMAEAIRKELLEAKQHQDIDQLKLKTSKSSAEELRQALLDARKRLEIAETAVKAREAAEKAASSEATEMSEKAAPAVATTNANKLVQTPEPEIDPFENEPESAADGVTLDLELEFEAGLSENQREHLIDLLDPGPKGNLDIFCVMGNENSELTAKQIEAVLAADGWKTNGVAKSAFANPHKGLLLVVNSKETAPSYASFLQRVFSTIGLTVSAKIDKKYREWSLSVIVGLVDD